MGRTENAEQAGNKAVDIFYPAHFRPQPLFLRIFELFVDIEFNRLCHYTRIPEYFTRK